VRCGQPSPLLRTVDVRALKAYGWALFNVGRVQEWCGHGREYVVLPGPGTQCQLVPVLDQTDTPDRAGT
jgi:hypothetical protein